jgi:hypothetical protein
LFRVAEDHVQPQHSRFVIAHNDPGIRAADEGTAVNCPFILHIAVSSSIENS